MKNSSNLNISCKVVFSLKSPSSFGRKRPFIYLNSSASIEYLSSSERTCARARTNHAINDVQKGCAMQLNGITLRLSTLEKNVGGTRSGPPPSPFATLVPYLMISSTFCLANDHKLMISAGNSWSVWVLRGLIEPTSRSLLHRCNCLVLLSRPQCPCCCTPALNCFQLKQNNKSKYNGGAVVSGGW